MDAEKWLLQIRKLDALIDAKIAERRRLWEIAADITGKPYDGMPITRTGLVSDKVGDSLMRIMECEEKIDDAIRRYTEKKEEIVGQLSVLPENEYRIIHLYYVMGWKWEDVAVKTGYCDSQVWRLKKSALRRLDEVLKAKKEDGS